MRADRLPGERPGYRGRHIRPAVPGAHRPEPSPTRKLWARRAQPVPYVLALILATVVMYEIVIGNHVSGGELQPYIPPPADPPAVACTDCTEDPAWAELGDDRAPVDDRTVPSRPSRNRVPTSPVNLDRAPGQPAPTSTSSPPGLPLVATPTVCPPPLPIAPPATVAPKATRSKGKPSRAPKIQSLTGSPSSSVAPTP